MFCTKLLLAVGIYTTHWFPNELNENNNVMAVQCNNVIAGTMINSYNNPTSFVGWNFELQNYNDTFTSGVDVMWVNGYTQEQLYGMPPVVPMLYVQAGPLRVSSLPGVVSEVSLTFRIR